MNDEQTTTGNSYEGWIGRDAYDRDGNKIGDIKALYYDADTDRPEWVAISTGWFGTSISFAPITGSSRHGEDLQLDVDEELVKDAPRVDEEDGNLSESDERRLYEHYSIHFDGGREAYSDTSRRDRGYTGESRADESYAVDQKAMTRHEEELEGGKVRVRKYVTTEQEPVQDEVRTDVIDVEDDAHLADSERNR
ncbi:hypothetical protein BH23ACT9_BH23ACT9_26380 [soil metagenome]